VGGDHDLVDRDGGHASRSLFLGFPVDSFAKDDCSRDSTDTFGSFFSGILPGSITHPTGFAISTIFTKGNPDSQSDTQSYPNA